ncbi:MAG TPA: AAA family ATPase [Opitutales bacterium]|nr:AAA family ATPase [Opitutales bacterium]
MDTPASTAAAGGLDPSLAQDAAKTLGQLRSAIANVIFGQEELIELAVTGLLAGGHILLEGLPGLGKTELVKSFSKALRLDTKRVQFTPDLLPGDITGNPVLQETNGERRFVFQPGPVFTNLMLADEINRASPKTQSALLEAMQERRVTVLGQTHVLPEPFFVLATQNPIELEGTYPLPEAQVDRFLFKLEVLRAAPEVLQKIVAQRRLGEEPMLTPVMTREELLNLIALARRVFLPPVVAEYIARLVNASHPGQSQAAQAIKYGASPRAAIGLAAAARARALIQGRGYAGTEDVQAVAKPVLQHRLILHYQARLEGLTAPEVTNRLVAEVPVEAKALPRTLAAAKVS